MATYGFISQHCILVLSIMMGDWPFSKASFAEMLITTKTLQKDYIKIKGEVCTFMWHQGHQAELRK